MKFKMNYHPMLNMWICILLIFIPYTIFCIYTMSPITQQKEWHNAVLIDIDQNGIRIQVNNFSTPGEFYPNTKNQYNTFIGWKYLIDEKDIAPRLDITFERKMKNRYSDLRYWSLWYIKDYTFLDGCYEIERGWKPISNETVSCNYKELGE